MFISVLTNLHGSNGETTLSTIANLHSVSASNMIGQYSPVTATAAAVAAAAAAAAVTGVGRSTPKTQVNILAFYFSHFTCLIFEFLQPKIL